jgi:hypothetical protein
MREDPVAEAVADAVAGDEQLASAAKLLAATAIATAQYYLTYGAPQIQLQIVRSLMPAIGRAVVERHDENEEMAGMRDQLRALQQHLFVGGSADE